MLLRRSLAILVALAILCPPAPAGAQRTEADVFVAEAIVQLDERQYDAALANLRRALQIEPEHLEAIYYIGLVHMARLRPTEALPFFERARRLAPDDPVIAYQLGLAYFALQQYERAEPLIEEAFRVQRSLDGVGYYAGYLRYRKKNYRGALDAFRVTRASDPEVQQLTRVYSAATLGILGLPVQAAAEVEEALRLAPGSAVTGVAERLRETLSSARGREKRLAAEVRAGFFYDDNVIVAPDWHSSDPLVRALRSSPRRSIGELAALRLDYTWLQEGGLSASAGYSFFAIFDDALPDFNITSHLTSVGSTFQTVLGTMPAQVGSQYAFDVLFLNEDQFLKRHTAALFGTLAESERHLTQAVARFQRKDFDESTPRPVDREVRDGNNYMIGGAHFLRFAQDRHYVKTGYQFDYEVTEGNNYTYHGHRLLNSALYTLPWGGVRLRYEFDVHLRVYDYTNTVLPSHNPGKRSRHDEEINVTPRIEVPLPWNTTLGVEYQLGVNHSNIQVFDYTRNVFSLQLSWTY